jgi:hypothetical protein
MGDEYLTIEQIETKYPNEWVLIDRPAVNTSDDVVGGAVVMHSPDRDEFDRRLGDFRLRNSAVLHVYDPFSEPLFLLSPLWIEDSIPDDASSTSPG